MFRLPLLALGALILATGLTGCDETGNLSGGSVERQITNAQIARQNGDYATAIRILEAAHAANPDNAPVRAELGLTLLERDGINLLDLDRVATFITSEAGTQAPAAPDGSALRMTCPYTNNPSATPFQLNGVSGFEDLVAARGTIREAMALLAPMIPSELRGFDICTSIGTAPGGSGVVFNYNRAAALAQMRALGLTDTQIGATLASNALVRFLDAYLYIALDLPQQTQWFRINGGSSIGVCADNPDALLGQAEDAVASLGQGALSIDLRATIFGANSTQQQLVELVSDGYLQMRDAIGDYCN